MNLPTYSGEKPMSSFSEFQFNLLSSVFHRFRSVHSGITETIRRYLAIKEKIINWKRMTRVCEYDLFKTLF
jgi:hypothetical protein